MFFYKFKVNNGDSEKMMQEYQDITQKHQVAHAALKKKLMAMLGGRE